MELCVRAVEQEPDSVRVLEEAGPVLLELGHTDRALDVGSIIPIHPATPTLHHHRYR